MPMQEVTNMSQYRVIHVDGTMLLPGQAGKIDADRAKSKPVKDMVDANELKLGAVQPDESEEAPKPPAPKPVAPLAPAPSAPASAPPKP